MQVLWNIFTYVLEMVEILLHKSPKGIEKLKFLEQETNIIQSLVRIQGLENMYLW